jgi:hypothetical protein
MKFLIEITLLMIMAFTDAKSQNKTLVSQFYVKERGTMTTILFMQDQNIYYLSYHKPGQLGFCIESSYSTKGDTLFTDKFGQFLIKRKQLLEIYKNEISKGSKYKSVNSIEKYINCLSLYGIFCDSSRIVIPRRLFGGQE